MRSEEFVKKMCICECVGPNGIGRPPEKWRDSVHEYMCERGATRGGGLDQGRRKCLDRERWRLFCRGYPLVERSRRRLNYREIDRSKFSVKIA